MDETETTNSVVRQPAADTQPPHLTVTESPNVVAVKLGFREKYIVEIIIFVFFIAKTLSDSITVNLLEAQVCNIVLKYDVRNCTEPLSSFVEDKVQPITANINMAKQMIEAFVPALLSLFIGPWSDENGRRTFLLMSLGGYTVSYAVWAGLSLIPNLHPEYFLIASIPPSLTGGLVGMFISLFCYISDTTKVENRAVRMALLEAGCMGGVFCGYMLTPRLLNIAGSSYGFAVVFSTSSFFMFIIFLYTMFIVPESVNVLPNRNRRFFKMQYVRDVFDTCFKHRPNCGRTVMLLVVSSIVIMILIMEGELTTLYLYLRERFQWQLIDYTTYSSFSVLSAAVWTLLGVWLMSALKLPEMPVSLTGAIFRAAAAIVCAFASSSWYFYLGYLLTCPSILIGPLARSQISKIVTPHEVGKVFAFMAFLETVSPLTAAPLYTFVYNHTMTWFLSAVFWVSAGLASLAAIALLIVVILQWWYRNSQYVVLVDSADGRVINNDNSSINT